MDNCSRLLRSAEFNSTSNSPKTGVDKYGSDTADNSFLISLMLCGFSLARSSWSSICFLLKDHSELGSSVTGRVLVHSKLAHCCTDHKPHHDMDRSGPLLKGRTELGNQRGCRWHYRLRTVRYLGGLEELGLRLGFARSPCDRRRER